MSSPTVLKRRKLDSASSFRPRQSSLTPKSNNPLNEDGISKCFHKSKASLYVALAPSYTQDPLQGIKSQHLDPLVMNYFPQAKGIVLAYFNVSLGSENKSIDSEGNDITVARITADTPFAFLWVDVEFLVWRPQLGDVVEGWINMQTQSHIGLLIHDTFNASIKKFNIPADWEFIPNQADEVDVEPEEDDNSNKFRSLGHWVDSKGVTVDGKIRFTVKALHTAGRVISVEGTLIEPGTESDSLPVTVTKQHKKFDDTVISVAIAESTKQKEDDLEIPVYLKNSDDEIIAEENSSSSDDSDSD